MHRCLASPSPVAQLGISPRASGFQGLDRNGTDMFDDIKELLFLSGLGSLTIALHRTRKSESDNQCPLDDRSRFSRVLSFCHDRLRTPNPMTKQLRRFQDRLQSICYLLEECSSVLLGCPRGGHYKRREPWLQCLQQILQQLSYHSIQTISNISTMSATESKPLVFVTGASGFLGFEVVYQLLEAGHPVRGYAGIDFCFRIRTHLIPSEPPEAVKFPSSRRPLKNIRSLRL